MTMPRLLAALLLAFSSAFAWGQSYPSKPVRILVPFVPGGNVDITARTVAPALGDALGQPVIVENRPGAGGMVGAQALAAAGADGYTLMMGSNSSLAVAPNLYPNWPYDPVKGIAPITNLQITPFVLVVKPALPAHTLAELLKLAKEKPGQLAMASGGNGSSNHLVGELFQMMTGVKFSHIPYRVPARRWSTSPAGRSTCCSTRRAPRSAMSAAGRSARSPLLPKAARAHCPIPRPSARPA
jgi:tripartite-type tricarboxylate transporter receptor subunit TctC